MTYTIRCPICGHQDAEDKLKAVFDLQDTHREEYGETHIFEFERDRII